MTEQANQTEAVVKKTRGRKAAVVAEAAVSGNEAAAAPAPEKKPRATRAKAAAADEAKPAAKKPRKSAAGKAAKEKVSGEERYQMVAMAAYFIAERRGFLAGYEHDDWLLAEQEIDARFEVI